MNALRLTFWPHARHGFAPGADGRLNVTATLAPGVEAGRAMDLLSYGDVTAIDTRQVLRCDPAPGAVDVSPNYLALIEFARADLPWLFSPAPTAGRCQPWLMLVVVDETDDSLGEAQQQLWSRGAFGEVLRVDAARLPDPTQAWLWAHVQALGQPATADAAAMGSSLSRLLCPTQLAPHRRYAACVVPTFGAGVAAGLGRAPTPAEAPGAPAWRADQGVVSLPVFYRFRFATGAPGDFEALVKRLRGAPLPQRIGVRRLTLDHPRSGLPVPLGHEAKMHATLYRPGDQVPDITSVAGTAWVSALHARLANAGFDITRVATATPHVGPPLYGQFPIRAVSVSSAAAGLPPWFAELNLDPRHRVAASLGTQVVQREQERYMAEAWRQIEQVQSANRLRRRGDYAVAASRSLYRRWITRLDGASLASTTAPMHKRLRVDGEPLTLAGRLRQSPLPPEIVSVEFRRITRAAGPRGATFRRLAMDGAALAQKVTETRPLVAHLAPDTIGRLDAPSSIWGAGRASEIVSQWMPSAGAMSPEAAVRQLDALSRPVALRLPEADTLAAQASSLTTRLDAFLGRNGLLPLSTVGTALAPGPAPAPAPPPPGGRRRPVPPGRLRNETRGRRNVPVPPAGRSPEVRLHVRDSVFVGGAVDAARPVDRLDRTVLVDPARPLGQLDRVADSNGSGFARLPERELGGVLQGWRDQGLVSLADDGALTVDALAIDRAARSGREATVVTAEWAASVLDGRYRRPEAATLDFGFDAARREAVIGEADAAVRFIGDRLLRDSDAAALVQRPLSAQFAELATVLRRELEPTRAITRLVNARIEGLSVAQAAARDDVMVAPELSEPTYPHLAALSQDWILPGIGELPPDSTTLAAANRAFIGAFLVGMNHELGRELLWREYPTDQRGSPARQFWSHRATGQPADAFDLRRPLHQALDDRLAGLIATAGGVAGDPLVLVVRGEVVRRYPGLIVQAATTVKIPGGSRRTMGTVIEPDFFGRLEPDVLLFGFGHLTEESVRAAADSDDTAIWFFFSEHFAEPRFGLDMGTEGRPRAAPPLGTPASWNAANWDHVTLSDSAVPYLTPSSSSAELPKADGGVTRYRWGADAASQAWICLQFPFRRGIPALQLLPEKATP